MHWILFASAATAQQFRMPVADEHTQYFTVSNYVDHEGVDWDCGYKRYSGHGGTDFSADGWGGMAAGRNLVATSPGVVVDIHDGEFDECDQGGGVCPGSPYGNYVKILHPDGWYTKYAHMRKWSVQPEIGDYVECGQWIGSVGSSGNSLGPHLHLDVGHPDGYREDPWTGPCSESSVNRWTDPGPYAGLPGSTCDSPLPECESAGNIPCGTVLESSNDGDDIHGFYGCLDWSYSGPEQVWTFATDRNEPVTVNVSGQDADVDLYVLESLECMARDCIASSASSKIEPEHLVFDAVSGMEYAIVVDGFKGATTSFTLEVQCEGDWPQPPEEEIPDEPDQPQTSMGCACNSGSTPFSWLLLPLITLIRISRRRPHSGTPWREP